MTMELDYNTVLDVALGGPEIGPLNLVTLHGLLHELFEKTGLSEKELIIKEEDPVFGGAYNFIKSKINESQRTPRTAGGGYSLERSKVSVIVSDYARSPIGKQNVSDKPKTPTIVPADVEERLKFIESELKIVKDFPSVDELRSWASEKTSPDTIVTDLWHFVSLNHRMNGAEEGIQKLTELVDKLIPELKKLNDVQNRYQGHIDDLYSQFKALSDRTTRTNERIDAAGEKAEQRLADIYNELKSLDNKLADYAKLNDLEDFVLRDTFLEEKEKARIVADQINGELATKAPLSLVSNLPDNSDFKRLTDEVNRMRDEMDDVARKGDLANLDIYVKWPQLEDAITPGNTRPNSARPVSGQSDVGETRNTFNSRSVIVESEINSNRPVSGSSGSSPSRPISGRSASRKSSRGSRPHSSSSFEMIHQQPREMQPSINVVKRLNELGMLAERQNTLMDALERTREQLAEKADKSELDRLLDEESLNNLLNLIRNMREEMSGLQAWRAVVDDEKVPALRNLLKELEEQTSTLLSSLSTLNEQDKKHEKDIGLLFTYIDRLEENKLERDDPLFAELAKNAKEKDEMDGSAIDGDHLNVLKDALKDVTERLENHENMHKKNISEITNSLDDKLDRAELQPLREYLENRYDYLTQQQPLDEDEKPPCTKHSAFTKKYPTPPPNKPRPSSNTSNKQYQQMSQPMHQDIPTRVNMTPNGHVDQLPCSHPHYGDGFVPHKNAAAFKTQMKFNCLSCDRPLTMEANSHFQTVRGRAVNGYELDQLRVLQRILKSEKLGTPSRACGGKHTTLPVDKRVSARVNSGKSLPAVDYDGYDDADLLNGEVDIEGLDGRLYRGLISQKDLKKHLRSKSANAQLRTVSPRMNGAKDRPVSGKSVDFTSSFSSGLGTQGSLDVHINQ